ncbi:MAG: hypothetical protein H7318_18110 [Oligoflexus sp.]|nr:hypothetical protein [Oligoflexus sp.]
MHKVRLRVAVCFALALVNNACLSTFLGTGETRSRAYKLPTPGQGWEAIDPAEADSAFRNKVDRAILNVSSICGEEKYRSLEDLTSDVLKQLPQNAIVVPSKTVNAGGHPGLVTEASGTVDGEGLSVRVAVIRTSKCIYDILLAGKKLDASSRLAFDAAVEGFSDGADL